LLDALDARAVVAARTRAASADSAATALG
jgi:hypothetical protein